MKRLILICWINLLLTQLFSQPVNPDSIWINGNISRMTNLSKIQKSGLKIDSIVDVPKIMDASYAESFVYMGKSYFEYYAKDKICIASSIIFDNKIETLTLGRHIINKATTWGDLKGMFPLDCCELKPINIYGQKERFDCCSIHIKDSQDRLWDMWIIFFFQNNKLVQIDFGGPS